MNNEINDMPSAPTPENREQSSARESLQQEARQMFICKDLTVVLNPRDCRANGYNPLPDLRITG